MADISLAPEKPALGRPPALVPDDHTLDILRRAGSICCTTKELAAMLDVSEPTLFQFWGRHPHAKDVFEKAAQKRKASLRRKQIEVAESGNATMMIWLGKNLLGQTDKTEVRGSGPGGSIPILNLTPEMLEGMTEEQISGIVQVLGKAALADGTVIEHEALAGPDTRPADDSGRAGDGEGGPRQEGS